MNNNEFAFIICTNNAQYYNECVLYIQELDVPDGYTTDIIAIQEANSMAQGYNAGMNASQAKYKIYLHHDVFILNRNFLYDILGIFKSNPDIGMLGCIGCQHLPADANCYLTWDTGKTKGSDGNYGLNISCYQEENFSHVEAIDGMIMITQYDVSWREDIFDGWDFYDVSQSIEMRTAGYKIAIPYQQDYWCYHDCGPSNIWSYDHYRKIIIEEYPDIFTGSVDEVQSSKQLEELRTVKDMAASLIKAIESGNIASLIPLMDDITILNNYQNKQICIVYNLLKIYIEENENHSGIHSELFYLSDWNNILEYYNLIRFILLRKNLGYSDERMHFLEEKISQKKISFEALKIIGATVHTLTT